MRNTDALNLVIFWTYGTQFSFDAYIAKRLGNVSKWMRLHRQWRTRNKMQWITNNRSSVATRSKDEIIKYFKQSNKHVRRRHVGALSRLVLHGIPASFISFFWDLSIIEKEKCQNNFTSSILKFSLFSR